VELKIATGGTFRGGGVGTINRGSKKMSAWGEPAINKRGKNYGAGKREPWKLDWHGWYRKGGSLKKQGGEPVMWEKGKGGVEIRRY